MLETTFTLIAWIMLGWRIEEVQLPHLSERQCGVFLDEMVAQRAPVRAECVPEPKSEPPAAREHRPDDYCVPCDFQRGIRRI